MCPLRIKCAENFVFRVFLFYFIHFLWYKCTFGYVKKKKLIVFDVYLRFYFGWDENRSECTKNKVTEKQH